MSESITCYRCGKQLTPHGYGFHTPGYGTDAEGRNICFDCCGDVDRQKMEESDKVTLYLSVKKDPETNARHWYVQNWPGTLKFDTTVSVSRNGHYSPLAGHMERRDAHFVDHVGHVWHGRSMGDNTEICHCERIKSRRAIERALWWLNPIWNLDGTRAHAHYVYNTETGLVETVKDL